MIAKIPKKNDVLRVSSLRLCCPQRAPLPYCAGCPDSVCLSLRAPGALPSDMLQEAFSHSCPTLRLHSGGTHRV